MQILFRYFDTPPLFQRLSHPGFSCAFRMVLFFCFSVFFFYSDCVFFHSICFKTPLTRIIYCAIHVSLSLCVFVSPLCLASPCSCVLCNGCDIYGQQVLRPSSFLLKKSPRRTSNCCNLWPCRRIGFGIRFAFGFRFPGLIKY